MTTFTSYSEYRAALARGERGIKFVSSTPSEVRTDNGISSHLKHTVAAIQASELAGQA